MMVKIRQVKWLASFAIQTLSFNSFQLVIICSLNFGEDLTSQDRLVMNIQGTSLITLLSFHLLLTRRFLLVQHVIQSYFSFPSSFFPHPMSKKGFKASFSFEPVHPSISKTFPSGEYHLMCTTLFLSFLLPTYHQRSYVFSPSLYIALSRSSFRSSSFPSS